MPGFISALALAIAAQTAAASPPLPRLTLPQQTALDCGVAFGLVAGEQRAGRTSYGDWPAVGERHREFFVRVSAQIMEQHAIGREQIVALSQASARRQLADPGAAKAAMPGCIALLDASGN